MRLMTLVIVLLGTVVTMTKSAHADEWNMIAAGCTQPAQMYDKVGVYESNSLKFQSGGTWPKQSWVYCPVTNRLTTSPSHLYFLYWAGANSTSGLTFVRAEYYKQHKVTGAITFITMVNSDNYPYSNAFQAREVPVNDVYDPATYYYYVAINMRTETSNGVVKAVAVTLW